MDLIETQNSAGTPVSGPEADRVAFFEMLWEGFCRAVLATGGTRDYFYRIGGEPVQLRFAGEALVPRVTRALAHLRAEPAAKPALTIMLWDSASTGTPLPLLAANLVDMIRRHWHEHLGARREITAFSDARIKAVFHLGPNILSALDLARSLALYWIPDAGDVPYYEQGHPLQTILNGWMTPRGRAFVHAAGICTRDGGVLLAGRGGTGKSTTTLACLNSELNVAGDDYCLISGLPRPYAHSLYNTVKLKGEEDLRRFPDLQTRFAYFKDLTDAKPLLFLEEHFPGKVSVGFPIKAVLVPHITGETATYTHELSPAAAMRALAPSTMLQLAGAGQSAMYIMGALVRQTPCYTLELGTNLAQIPEAIAHVIAG
jgi:hypothetical protein